MKKKIISILTAFCLMFMLVELPEKAITAAAAGAGNAHVHRACNGLSHDNCNHGDITFEPFPDDAHTFRGGNYYLTKDFVIDTTTEQGSRIFIEPGVTNICLNGYSIKKDGGQIIDINKIGSDFATLNICDCKGGGTIVNTSTSDTDSAFYSAVSVIDGCELNIYGGTIDGGASGVGAVIENVSDNIPAGGSINLYGGAIKSDSSAGVWINAYDGSLNVYGGEVSSQQGLAISAKGDNCTVLISGGEVIGNGIDNEALYIYGENAKAVISGGKVTGKNYAAILCSKGSLEIKGGEVKSENGADAVYNKDTLVLSGSGKITCSGDYGIWNYSGGKTTISGGEINSDGAALRINSDCQTVIEGGSLSSKTYAAIYNYGKLSISGGEIISTDSYFGAVWNEGSAASLEINDGDINANGYILCNSSSGVTSISGGTLIGSGMSVFNYDNATLNISGGSFGKDNTADAMFISNESILNLSSSPTFNNTSLWLKTDDNIGITGELTYTDPCKVYIERSAPVVFTSGWSIHMGDKKPSDYFKSPYPLYTVAGSDGEALEALLRGFLITFNANGGTCSTADTGVDDYGKALLLPEAEQKGYTFDGWYTAADGGDKVTSDTVFSGDIELYAHWNDCNHVWGNTIEKDSSRHWKVCTICGADGETADHQWDGGATTKEPTEEAAGVKTYTCTVCGQSRTEEIPKLTHTHTFSDDWTSDETHHWHAATCGHTSEVSDKAAHTWNDGEITTPATETTGGVKTYTCTACGKTRTETIAKLDHTHTPSDEWTSDPAGHWHTCSGCTEKLDFSAHTEDGGVVTVQPTKTKTGTKTFKCTVCGYVMRTETIPATGGSGGSGGSGGTARPSRPSHTHTDHDGSISEKVQPGANAPETTITTPLDTLADIVLTPAERAEVNDGTDIIIILTIEDGTYLVPAADKARVEAVISGMQGYKLGQYLDVNLLKIIGGIQENIYETNTPITVMFEIPEALRGEGREYAVIRVHDGETAVLPDLDKDADTVTIQSDKFSTYALVYSEETDSDASGESSSDTGEPVPESSEQAKSGEASSESGGGSSEVDNSVTGDETSPTGESGKASGDSAGSRESEPSENPGDSAPDDNNPVPGESSPAGDSSNPVTGIAVTIFPLGIALAAVTVSVKRRKK